MAYDIKNTKWNGSQSFFIPIFLVIALVVPWWPQMRILALWALGQKRNCVKLKDTILSTFQMCLF